MNPNPEHAELKELILENQRLLAENNMLLKKMQKSATRQLWLKIIWIVFLLGAPLILLYNVILPMTSSLGSGPSSVSGQLKEMQELQSFLQEQR